MKIAFILPAFYPSNKGTPASIREKCRTLQQFNQETIVICYHRYEEKEPYAKVYRIPRNPFYKRGSGPAFSRIFLDLLLFWKSIFVISKEKPDLLHAVTQEGALTAYFLKKIFKIPFVFDLASISQKELIASGFAKPQSLVARTASFLDKKLPQKADFNITVSQGILVWLQKRGIKKAKFIPDTVDLNLFKPQAHPKTTNRIFIGYQGSLAKIQNLDLLFDIARATTFQNPKIVFKIGSSENMAELNLRIKKEKLTKKIKLEKVEFSEAPGFINSCHLMIIPRKLSVGTPVKLLNFLACGKPIVVFKKVVENLSREKIVLKANNEKEFQEGILRLAQDRALQERLGQKARNFALKNFNRRS